MRVALPCIACLALAACCVIVIQNGGSDGGNPFDDNLPPTDGGLIAPVAICRAVPVDAGIGELVTFDGSDSEPSPGASAIVTWDWDFGDGATGMGSIETHAYGDAGFYYSTLTVTDDQGLTAQNSCPAVAVQP